jgi:hypothetical protein
MSCVNASVGEVTGAAAGGTLRQAVVVGVCVRVGVLVGVAQNGQLHASGKCKTAPAPQVGTAQRSGVQVGVAVGVDCSGTVPDVETVGVDSGVVGVGVGVCSGVALGDGHPCKAFCTHVTNESIPATQVSPSEQELSWGQADNDCSPRTIPIESTISGSTTSPSSSQSQGHWPQALEEVISTKRTAGTSERIVVICFPPYTLEEMV